MIRIVSTLELIFFQEKEKMKVLEEKMSEVKKNQSATGHPDELLRDGGRSKNLGGLDFIGETESEDESLNEQLELNSELDARLSRLALLDQTQQEIDQISVATESMLQQSKNCNLFVTSKNETTNSPIHEIKVLQNVFYSL